MDLLLCILGFPLFIIAYLTIGSTIKLEDGGSIFYGGERLGKNGKVYKMYKFRSMKVNAPDIRNQDGSTYNAKNDPRVTKIGKLIREASIDEIPQILNVFKGDMSVIGPRPGLPDMLDRYTLEEMPRLEIRPGITGYCQAYYRNSISGQEKRLKDAWYANNVSFWLDIKIFSKTIITVLKKDGLYKNKENF